jgi:hypothetical protein
MSYIIGIDPSTRDSSAQFAPLTLGTTSNYKPPTTASNGTLPVLNGAFQGALFVYAQVATGQTIVPGDAVAIINATFQVSQLTKALADALHRVAIAPDEISGTTAHTSITAGQWAWFQIYGATPGINVANGTTADSALYTTATAGRLSATATSQTLIRGAAINTTAGADAVIIGRLNTIISAT